MATVPEVQTPSVAPSGTQPLQNINAPAGAFGGGIAQAGEGVARATEGGADLLEQHQIVMTGLANKANSDAASVDFAATADKIRTDFVTNQRGGNAQPAYDDYVTQVNTARDAAKATLTNPMAQQMFDSDSRRTAFNITSDMARHAATEQNQYINVTSVAKEKAAGDQYVQSPDNPGTLANLLSTTEKETTFRAIRMGLNPEREDDKPVIAEMIAQNRSKPLMAAIESTAATDYPKARAMFDANKDLLDTGSVEAGSKYLAALGKPYVANQLAEMFGPNGHAPTAPSVKDIQNNPHLVFSSILGQDVTVTSGARSTAQNAEANGVVNSLHIPGNGVAFDFVPKDGNNAAAVAKLKAAELNPKELFVDPNQNGDGGSHVHVGWTTAQIIASQTGKPPVGVTTPAQLDEMIAPRQAALNTYVDKYLGGDPEIKASASRNLDAEFGRLRMGLDAQAQASQGRLFQSLGLPGDQQAHPINQQQLFQSYPGAQNDYLALTPLQREGVDRMMVKNAHPTFGDMTPEQLDGYHQLAGEQIGSPKTFANHDLLADPRFTSLPAGTANQLWKSQQQLRAGQPTNPTLTRALSLAKPYLDQAAQAGDFPALDNNKADVTSASYHRFTSALTANVTAYHDINKADPPPDKVQLMIQHLLLNKAYLDPNKAQLSPGVPDDFTKAAMSAAYARGKTLNDAQLQALYAKKNVAQ